MSYLPMHSPNRFTTFAASVMVVLCAFGLNLIFWGSLLYLCICLAACDRDHSHAGSSAHQVPDANNTGLLIAVVVLALVFAAVVEKWMRGDK